MATPYVPYSGPLVTRAEATATGSRWFFVGVVCGRGHLSQRRLSDGTCAECCAIDRAAWKSANRVNVNSGGRDYYQRNRATILAKEKVRNSTDDRKAQRKTRYQADTDAAKQRASKWKLANPERVLELRQAHYDANKDAITQRVRDWNEANPGRSAVRGRNYRARLFDAEGSHTHAEIMALYAKQRGRCIYCKTTLGKSFHADHIEPLARGGSNWITNIQLTCMPCNNRKRATDPAEYARRIGLLL